MTELTVGVVASPRQWRSDLQSHVRNHVVGVRLKILREPRTALDEHLDVMAVDDVASFLTPGTVKRLRERGVRIVGVFDPSEHEGQGERYLLDMGVDLTVPATASAEQLLGALSSFGTVAQVSDEIAALEAAYGAPPPAVEPVPAAGGVTVVSGASDSPGATEIAIALAGALAARRERTILVDADDVAPSVARRLLFNLDPNILTALDDVHYGAGTLRNSVGVRQGTAPGSVHFAAIPGLANAADWNLIRDGDLITLIDELERAWDHVVINAGPHLEDLGAGMGPDRFGASRATVSRADRLIGVCSASPLGVLRFLDWAAEARALQPDVPIWVVVNRAPKSSYKRAELEQELRQNIGPEILAGLSFVPHDDRVADAVWDGAPVARGPFTKAVGELARIVPITAAAAGRRAHARARRGRA